MDMNHTGQERCVGSVSRRAFLEAGSLALGGLTLPDLLAGRAAARESGRSLADTSVILIWLQVKAPKMRVWKKLAENSSLNSAIVSETLALLAEEG